jgi:DNA mismatch endonuclease (patch repair protein)
MIVKLVNVLKFILKHCRCGCGEKVKFGNRFISGHNLGISWNKGLSKEVDKRLRIMAENKIGKKHTKESKRKMGLSNVGRRGWNKGLTKETDERVKKQAEKMLSKEYNTCFLLGKKLYEESKEYFCACGCGQKIVLKHWHRSEGVPKYLHGHNAKTFEFKQKQKEWIRQKVIPFQDTSIEIKLQNALTRENIIFEKHKPIIGHPDIFISPNVCVFADGDYWHGNPKFYKESDTIAIDKRAQEIWDKDLSITKTLTSKGYTILRFWEHEINSNLEECISRIKEIHSSIDFSTL